MHARVSTLLVAAAAMATGSQAQVAAPVTEPVTAFVDVSVIPMDRERVLAHQTVVVRGGRIVALGPTSKMRAPAGAERIDGRGKFLIPGLADMHVHIGFGGDTAAAKVTQQLFAYLANGVTTVRDMHSGGRTGGRNFGSGLPQTWILALRHQLATGALVGPRIYAAGDPDLSSPAAAAQSVAELKADGHDFVKIALGGWPASQELYDSLLGAARRIGLRAVGHVPKRLSVSHMLAAPTAAPWASTEHLYEYVETVLGLSGRWSFTDGGILANLKPAYADTAVWMRPGYRLDPARLRALAQATRRAGVWNCPTLYMSKDFANKLKDWPGGGRVLARFDEFYGQVTKVLQNAGAGLLLGTDAGGAWPGPVGFSVHGELAAFVDAGLTPYQALATGTRNVAEFLGTLDSTSTVAVGKRADLVLLDANPLEDITHTTAIRAVVANGRYYDRAALDRLLSEA